MRYRIDINSKKYMRTLLGISAAFLIGRWLYLNMKEKVKVVVEKIEVEKEKIIEVATDSWRS